MPKKGVASTDSWQQLVPPVDIAAGVVHGKTKSPESELKSVAVLIVQESNGRISGLACGIGTPDSFEQDGDEYAWTLNVGKLAGKPALKPGLKARGFSLVERRSGVVEGWTTSSMSVIDSKAKPKARSAGGTGSTRSGTRAASTATSRRSPR